MSVRRLAEEQPASFEFTPENKAWAEKEIAKYPPGRQASAVLALLWRAQKQSGYWLSKSAIETVAATLDMPNIRVLEVATFYTMFNLAPVGRHYIQLCGTTPCMLCGAEDLKAVCRKRIGEQGNVTSDGLFSWTEVECLGACCNAPMVQINEDYYEDLAPETFAKLLDDLAAGRPVKTGSQIGRVSSEPIGGLTALTTFYGAEERLLPSGLSSEGDGGTPKAVEGTGASPPGAEKAPMTAPSPQSESQTQRQAAKSDVSPQAIVAATPVPTASVATVSQLDDAESRSRAAAEEALISDALEKLPSDATPEQKANAVGSRPLALSAARGQRADDLQRIRGVGPVNEKHLNDLGVFHFDQIAAWTRAEIRWVATYLAFPGRIDREQWVSQADNLTRGGTGSKDGGVHVRLDSKPGT